MKTSDISGPHLFLAVLRVREGLEGLKLRPGSEHWTYSDESRRKLWELVREEYCSLTGCELHDFPFSTEAVAMVNVRWRKESKNNLAEAIEKVDRLIRLSNFSMRRRV